MLPHEIEFYRNTQKIWRRDFWKRLNLIPLDQTAAQKCAYALKKSEILLIAPEIPATQLSDRERYIQFIHKLDVTNEFELGQHRANFLNHTVFATSGFLKLSQRFDCPIIFAVIRRKSELNYILSFEELKSLSQTESIEEKLNAIYQRIEEEIRKTPSSWSLWCLFHKMVSYPDQPTKKNDKS